MELVEYLEQQPSIEDYNRLRYTVGWQMIDPPRVQEALSSSLYSVCAVVGGMVIGCGRVIGDGGIYFYIQDVLVEPRFQLQGVGHGIVQRLMAFLDNHAPEGSGAFMGLMTSTSLLEFYGHYGFHCLSDDCTLMGIRRNKK